MGRRTAGPARHRAVRPRYGRITSAVTALGVTVVALLGATGVLPVAPQSQAAPQAPAAAEPRGAAPAEAGAPVADLVEGRGGDPVGGSVDGPAGSLVDGPGMTTPSERSAAASDVLPLGTGAGRRVVFSIGAQRVWLVGADDGVRRTYPVSGSLTDNLDPGTYEVYSTSRDAVGIDDSGTMRYMVRFAHGRRAAIGFHDIPVKDGQRVQTRAELGTPRSSGCIRQARPDARALWDFAPVGTAVVVVA